jgi:hypothetical protein
VRIFCAVVALKRHNSEEEQPYIQGFQVELLNEIRMDYGYCLHSGLGSNHLPFKIILEALMTLGNATDRPN